MDQYSILESIMGIFFVISNYVLCYEYEHEYNI